MKQIKRIYIVLLLCGLQTFAEQDNPCRHCPEPCRPNIEEIRDASEQPQNDRDSYEHKKQLLHAALHKRTHSSLTEDDLHELMEKAKEQGDYDTHAQAFHVKTLKIEMDAEDGDGLVVFKLKDLHLSHMIVGVSMAAAAAVITHLIERK